MTTFANSFSPFATMQTGEDFMEVSNDPERRNAMEEDNFDIDIDLMDGPQDGPDEDSMMDDEPADGDQDHQMNDDYEELGNQDAEITDFVDDVPADIEVPMTEESAVQHHDPQHSLPNLFNTDVVSETPAIPSFATQSPIASTASQAAGSAQPQEGQSIASGFAQPATSAPTDETAKLESIRTLYETPSFQNDESALQAADKSGNHTGNSEDEDPKPQDHSPGAAVQSAEKVSERIEQYTAAQDPVAAALAVTEKPLSTADIVASHEPVETAKKSVEISQTTTDDVDQNHEQGQDTDPYDEAGSGQVDPDGGPDDTPAEPFDILPVTVIWQDNELSLFPPLQEHEGTPPFFLLPDASVADEPISTLLQVCHSALATSLDKHESIEVYFPSFGFTVRQHDPEASQHTLRHIAELCAQFQQHDGIETPQAMKMHLKAASSLTGHLNFLYDLASEGKGLTYVEELYSSNLDGAHDEFETYEGDEAEHHTEELSGEQAWPEEENDANAEGADLNVPEPDPEDGQFNELDQLEQHDEVATALTQPAASTESEAAANPPEQPTDASVQQVEVSKATAASSQHEQTSVQANAANDENAPSEQGHYPAISEESNHAPASGENAQTAEELDFDDDEEWDIEDPANIDETDATGARRSAFEQDHEPSQSLHNAIQPEPTTTSVTDANTNSVEHTGADTYDIVDPVDAQPTQSETSSTTIQANDTAQNQVTTATGEEENDNIFDDNDEDYTGVDNIDDQGDDGDDLDFGLDDQPTKSPSLKRIRSEVDEVGGEAGGDEDHPLKRSRSG